MVGGAIQSVLDQTCTDWELIVVDDGSTDDTRVVAARYNDPRIHYIYQENRKLPGARNTGIRASTGQYLAFLDSDDLFLPEKLALQLAVLVHNHNLGLVASGWTEIDLQHAPLRTHCPWKLGRGLTLMDWLRHCPFIVPAVLVRREWLAAVGLFDERQYYVEDWDLWLRLSYAGCQMAWEPGIVCLRTIHGGNMIHNAAEMNAGRFRMFDKFFAQPDLPHEILEQRDRVYAGSHLGAAVRAFGAGAGADGQTHLVAAVRLAPSLLDGHPPAVLQSIASTALTHQVRDVDRYVLDVSRVLAEVSPGLARSPRQLKAMIRAAAAFEHLAHGRRQPARLSALQAVWTDPAWLENRGLLKILVGP
jgi:hypothetical protein